MSRSSRELELPDWKDRADLRDSLKMVAVLLVMVSDSADPTDREVKVPRVLDQKVLPTVNAPNVESVLIVENVAVNVVVVAVETQALLAEADKVATQLPTTPMRQSRRRRRSTERNG